MKIGVVGSRTITTRDAVKEALRDAPFTDSDSGYWWMHQYVSGGADGVDTVIESMANEKDWTIEVIEPDYSDWSGNEHPAKRRNTQIVEESDVILAVWDGKSNGTRDTIDKALDRGMSVYVHVVE